MIKGDLIPEAAAEETWLVVISEWILVLSGGIWIVQTVLGWPA